MTTWKSTNAHYLIKDKMTDSPERGMQIEAEMTTSGLYQNFEASFGSIAMALKTYLGALNRKTTLPGEPTPQDYLDILNIVLKEPVKEYDQYLRDAWPDDAEKILAKSNLENVEKANNAIRRLNNSRSDIAAMVGIVDELYAIMGTDERIAKEMRDGMLV